MLQPLFAPNDKKANRIILFISVLVFVGITALSRVKIEADLGFDAHVFALINASLNSIVTLLLLVGFYAVKAGKLVLHRNLMAAAIILSVLFLLSYVAHHLLTDATKFGDINRDNIVSDQEKAGLGVSRTIYYILLLTHIPLAGIILPFILFTAYRALSGQYEKHKKLARFTWPVWLYVAISGVVIYLMINPYY